MLRAPYILAPHPNARRMVMNQRVIEGRPVILVAPPRSDEPRAAPWASAGLLGGIDSAVPGGGRSGRVFGEVFATPGLSHDFANQPYEVVRRHAER